MVSLRWWLVNKLVGERAYAKNVKIVGGTLYVVSSRDSMFENVAVGKEEADAAAKG